MTPTDLAWAAGFIDGEGTITITGRGRPGKFAAPGGRTVRTGTHQVRGYIAPTRVPGQARSYSLAVSAVNRNMQPLQKLIALFGGSIYTKQGSGNRLDAFCWTVTGDRAFTALQALRPYLVGKTAVADVCLEFHPWYRATQRSKGHAMSAERRAKATMYFYKCRQLIRLYHNIPVGTQADRLAESPAKVLPLRTGTEDRGDN